MKQAGKPRIAFDGDGVIAAYLRALDERVASARYRDRTGRLVGPVRPSERRSILAALVQIAAVARAGLPVRLRLELAEDARKEVVLFLGLLPLVQAHAAKFPRVLYLAADARLETRAQRAFAALDVRPRVSFATWAAVADRFQDRLRARALSGTWVMGDVDWAAEPADAHLFEERRRGLAGIWSRHSPLVLVHQQGKKTLVPWPPGALDDALPPPSPCALAWTLLARAFARLTGTSGADRPGGL